MPPRPKRTTTKEKTSGGDASGGEDDSPRAIAHSTSIKKRTGQACIRCRQRKIKCDHNTRGCQACKDAGEECQVKDRNTHKIIVRGQDEDKDAEIKSLKDDVRRLTERLKPFEPPDPMFRVDTPFRDGPPPRLPNLDPRNPGEAYLGTTGTAGFSVICGSKMSIYGNEFDLFQYFESSEESALFQLNDKEYDDHVSNSVTIKRPKRPDIKDANENAHLFFTGISFFVPVVHRPTFFNLLSHLYHPDAPQRAADKDIVIFEMVMSIAQFQLAKRNPPGSRDVDQAREAKQRLLYCLTFVPSLLQSPESEAMQGLVLICMAMRHLQRPGPACRFCRMVFDRATELGYHRSITAFPDEPLDQHNIQMRQRLFWCLMVFDVNISGNLGRALRLRFNDYDIEIPEPTNDDVPATSSDTSPDQGRHRSSCSWSYAPLGFRLTEIEHQAYCTFRCIRNRGSANQMHDLKLQLIDIEGELPVGPPDTNNIVAFIAGQYLQLGVCATRLKLLHPANVSEAFNQERRREILKASGQILEVARILAAYKSLDTTVYYSMDFIHAIFMDLYVAHRNAEDGIPVDMPHLDQTMNKWYWVLGELGEMLGTGHQLVEGITKINENVIRSIKHILKHGNTRGSSEPMLGQYHESVSTSLGTYYENQIGDHVVQHEVRSSHPLDYAPLASDATLGGDAVSPASSHPIMLQNAPSATAMNPAYPSTVDAMHGNYYPHPPGPTGMQLVVPFDNDFGWSNSMQMHGEPTPMDTDMGEAIYNGAQPYSALDQVDLQNGGNHAFQWRGMYDVHPNDGSGTHG